MKKKTIIFIFYFLIWIFLNWSIAPENIIVGIIIAAIVTMLTADVYKQGSDFFTKPSRYLWFLYYLAVFAWECLKANLDSAYRVLHPDLPIKPGIVKVRTALKTDTALTILANTLSLKPGTMTVDINKEKGLLYVHWANVECQDIDGATKIIVERFEKILKRIFE
ncbi:MAG: Na+/H+ antiporter subunit E [Candidatus Omnitrophica bacterium]|nr:Na+/H+ antiporter subunit E [Candidatus Omnitrophota bacterium]